MIINKDNAIEEITNYLKSKKCIFTYDDYLFEIIVGSESCFIQVEIYPSTTIDEDIYIQFYDNSEDPLFEIGEEVTNSESLEGFIDQLIEFTKEKVKKINKIYRHIQAIREICEEMDVDVDNFIETKYDFEKF